MRSHTRLNIEVDLVASIPLFRAFITGRSALVLHRTNPTYLVLDACSHDESASDPAQSELLPACEVGQVTDRLLQANPD